MGVVMMAAALDLGCRSRRCLSIHLRQCRIMCCACLAERLMVCLHLSLDAVQLVLKLGLSTLKCRGSSFRSSLVAWDLLSPSSSISLKSLRNTCARECSRACSSAERTVKFTSFCSWCSIVLRSSAMGSPPLPSRGRRWERGSSRHESAQRTANCLVSASAFDCALERLAFKCLRSVRICVVEHGRGQQHAMFTA